jgi:hypothetical protein
MILSEKERRGITVRTRFGQHGGSTPRKSQRRSAGHHMASRNDFPPHPVRVADDAETVPESRAPADRLRTRGWAHGHGYSCSRPVDATAGAGEILARQRSRQ